MADETVIQVDSANAHPESGHISIKVRSVTTRTVGGNTQITNGPWRTYGVDAAGFHSRFNGDLEQLKNWIKGEHQAYQGAHESLVDTLSKLKGTTL